MPIADLKTFGFSAQRLLREIGNRQSAIGNWEMNLNG